MGKAIRMILTIKPGNYYCGSFIYEDDVLQTILTADLSGSKQSESRVVVDGSNYA